MLDLSRFLPGHEGVIDVEFGVQVGVDIHFADVVKEVEVKVVHLALLQLFVEDLLHLVHVGQIVTGKFIGQIEAVPGILPQNSAHYELGIAVVVAPCGVVVVDACLHSPGDHAGGFVLVDNADVAADGGQTHTAKAQGGQLQVLELLVDHGLSSFPLTNVNWDAIIAL